VCGRIFGGKYSTVEAPGVVTGFSREVGNGRQGRLVGKVTADYLWADGRTISKKINQGTVQLAPDDDPVHQEPWVIEARRRRANLCFSTLVLAKEQASSFRKHVVDALPPK